VECDIQLKEVGSKLQQ